MQVCTDTSEAIELFLPQGLYLKPVARVSICVQLPQMKLPGKSISNWEVMEKIKRMIRPDEFTMLKVTKSTLEFIRFEGETENRTNLKGIVARLENKSIKLSGFPDMLKVRSAEAKINFPTRHDWDSYFRDAKNMNEMKPGERPDTIHFQNLPCRWFANKKDQDQNRPSEYILKKVFENYGDIRLVDIPMLDPYLREITKKNGSIQTFSFGHDLTFEAYIQYREYIGFVKAMTALKGMKLLHKGEDGKCFTAEVKVEFDKSKYLSEENMKKRQSERDKLIQLEKEREARVLKERELEERKKEEERARQEEEEKERERKREEKIRKRDDRRKDREEKRRLKLLEKKRHQEEQKVAEKNASRERKDLIEMRKTEALRLLTVLFDRVKEGKQKEEVQKKMQELEKERLRQLQEEEQKKETEKRAKLEEEEKRWRKLAEEEKLLRERLVKNLKTKQEVLMEQEREKLRKEISGKTKLKSVLIKIKGEKIVKSHSKRHKKDVGKR